MSTIRGGGERSRWSGKPSRPLRPMTLVVPMAFAAVVVLAYAQKTGVGLSWPALGGSESIDTLLARGSEAHRRGDEDEALGLYRRVLARDPGHAAAHYNVAQVLNARGRFAEAQAEYEAALRSDPRSLDARINLGVVLYRQRQFAAAAREFRVAVELSPRNPTAMFDLATALLGDGKPGEAIPWLLESRREQPAHADTHLYLGLALEQTRRYGEARAAFRRALELNPRSPEAQLGLARIASALGQRDQAIDTLRKAAGGAGATGAEK